ncbi:FtsQ-type POTRA domain-containing protein [Cyanobium sp. CH-040]|uniref:cell division protein FtsQ/DivIB n=1 Tax=Cyanobium sp. CH-040 TaxID=2823708 RepID=UPI0020CD1595|nr:FtsQ-type POTRA domain-containing protein [Cyanobium sp. CH-040]MCP9926415.1 FtsQ-type POTRA domain-containing protein [Cyanobium sp. CH-040]
MSQARPLPPGVERRRQLRLQRRNERLRNGWRMLVLLGLSAGLGTLLLRYGWSLTSAEQVEVVGSSHVGREQVISAAELRFPQPLLSLEPQQLAAALKQELPVEDVRVSRWIAPPRLRVTLVDRQPVARAQRRGPQGMERGYVDRHGHWMSARQGQTLANPASSQLEVLGWQERHRSALRMVMEHSDALRADLRQIRFEPDGSLWVQSTRLGNVRLGPRDERLERRLTVLEHLTASLPAQLQGRRLQAIDLSEPEQPELTVAAPAPTQAATASARP